MVRKVFTKKPNDPPLWVIQFLYTTFCGQFYGDLFGPIFWVPQEALVINEDPPACDHFKVLTDNDRCRLVGWF
jgi:hypothetical protein